MSRKRIAAALLAVVSFASVPVIGEVAVEPEGPRVSTMLLAIIEDPDPINGHSWQPIRNVDPVLVLNPGGFDRQDGRPEIVYLPDTGRPVVLWAYNRGSHHDIAFSDWEGTHWREPLFLTQDASDDLDPRADIGADGSIVAVWWRDGLEGSIFATRRPVGSTLWQAENEVTELFESGMRPSVVMHEAQLVVAYERALLDQRQVVVAVEVAPGQFTKEVLGQVACSGTGAATCASGLDVILHAQAGRLWVDWKTGLGELAFRQREAEAGWSATTLLTAPDSTWLGIELGRRQIRSQLAGP